MSFKFTMLFAIFTLTINILAVVITALNGHYLLTGVNLIFTGLLISAIFELVKFRKLQIENSNNRIEGSQRSSTH